MDLSFLRTLASAQLPRRVTPGPAFNHVLTYEAAGYVEVSVPEAFRTRSGSSIQYDAIVTAITPRGLAALQAADQRSE